MVSGEQTSSTNSEQQYTIMIGRIHMDVVGIKFGSCSVGINFSKLQEKNGIFEGGNVIFFHT